MKMGLGPGLGGEDGTGSRVFRVQGLGFRLVGVRIQSGTIGCMVVGGRAIKTSLYVLFEP